MPTPLVAPTNTATRPEACPDSLNARFDLRTSLILTILIKSMIDWWGKGKGGLHCNAVGVGVGVDLDDLIDLIGLIKR
jgi:hypothetical protein